MVHQITNIGHMEGGRGHTRLKSHTHTSIAFGCVCVCASGLPTFLWNLFWIILFWRSSWHQGGHRTVDRLLSWHRPQIFNTTNLQRQSHWFSNRFWTDCRSPECNTWPMTYGPEWLVKTWKHHSHYISTDVRRLLALNWKCFHHILRPFLAKRKNGTLLKRTKNTVVSKSTRHGCWQRKRKST